MRYLSVCSGIEAATVAWHVMGWKPVAVADIDPFACALLQTRHPLVPNLGDITAITEDAIRGLGNFELLVGGTPCQSFSVAGLRKGLADPRGQLVFGFLRLSAIARPAWVVWENVPGVLSADEGRAFGAFVGGMAELGYGWAYRVLDAQYVRVDGLGRAVPQRRRRVFVVGCLGDWRRSAAVLFERSCLCGNPAPRRKAGTGVARDVASGLGASGRGFARTGESPGQDCLVAHTLRADGFDAGKDGTGRGTPIVPVCFGGNNTSGPIAAAAAVNAKGGSGRMDFETETLVVGPLCSHSKEHGHAMTTQQAAEAGQAVAFQTRIARNGRGQPKDVVDALTSCEGGTHADSKPHVAYGACVRRLTPLECERLQGFPDNYTLIDYRGKPASDGPRYRALGNSMAVNVMRWIGRRIEMVEGICSCSS